MKRSAARAARTAREQALRYDVYLTTTGLSRGLCAKILRDQLPGCDLHDAVVLVQKALPVVILTDVERRVARFLQGRLRKVKATVSLQAKTNRRPIFRLRDAEAGFQETVLNDVLPALIPASLAPHTLECDVSTRLRSSHHGCGCICHQQEGSDE